jgi:hypothetical protein
VAAVFPRADIAYVSVADVPPGQVGLAWDGSWHPPLITDFVTAARSLSRRGAEAASGSAGRGPSDDGRFQ